MREIKFRVWWIHPESSSEGFDYFDVMDGWKQSDPCQEVIAIEQFIGLRDKNGREIYEGDILEILSYNGTGSYKKLIGAVFFKTQGSIDYCYKVKTYGNFGLNSNDVNGYTIIGNIHENPELLK